ncbi:MAG: RyR domain-containing protein [Ignavibacteriales bacterium]
MKNLGCNWEKGFYAPEAVDTSSVVLPDELLPLCNVLAKNSHDIWAAKRLSEGVTYGNGENQNPYLVPFELLDDEEKKVNLITIQEPIKILMLMGFDVTPPAQLPVAELQTIEAFKPEPIDISGIVIDEALEAAADAIAYNAHEVWSIDRLQAGWIWAEVRDNDKKLHPLLKPFEELTENDKSYDKDLAFGNLKAIVALGGSIVKRQ